MPIDLIEPIAAAARARGLSMRQVALQAGVRPETVSRIRRRANCDYDTLARLAAAAGLEIGMRPAGAAAGAPPDSHLLQKARRGEAQERQRAYEARLAREHDRVAAGLALGALGAPDLVRARRQVARWVKQGTCSPWYARRWSEILAGKPAEAAARLLALEEGEQKALYQNTPFGFLVGARARG